MGSEFAAVVGPVPVQAEYMRAFLDADLDVDVFRRILAPAFDRFDRLGELLPLVDDIMKMNFKICVNVPKSSKRLPNNRGHIGIWSMGPTRRSRRRKRHRHYGACTYCVVTTRLCLFVCVYIELLKDLACSLTDFSLSPLIMLLSIVSRTFSLKKRPNKRGRFQPHGSESFLATSQEEASLSSFDSPQTGNTPGSYFTPQPPSTLLMMDHLPPTATRSNRVVQFGPSQAVSFQAGTPVEGGLEPLPEADVQFPTDSDSFILDEEEQAALEETKANAACLAEWEGMIDIGDDEDKDDTFVLSTRRPGRRSSTFFSPNPKSLLDEPDTRTEEDDEDEDDDDKNDGEPDEQHVMHAPEHVNDPVEKLVLSALQVNSPTLGGGGDDSDKNKEERMSTSPIDTVSVRTYMLT